MTGARRRRRRTALISSAAVGIVLAAFVGVLATRSSAVDKQAFSPLLGKLAPPLTGTDLDGRPFDLTSLRGRFVLVNFFASWCVPCQHEQPQLVRFSTEPSPARTVVGVLFEDQAGPARSFLTSNGGAWPALADGSYQHALDWGVRGPPESFLVDPRGVVLAKFVGEVTAGRLDALMARAGGA